LEFAFVLRRKRIVRARCPFRRVAGSKLACSLGLQVRFRPDARAGCTHEHKLALNGAARHIRRRLEADGWDGRRGLQSCTRASLASARGRGRCQLAGACCKRGDVDDV
jgi:hypothetical protein